MSEFVKEMLYCLRLYHVIDIIPILQNVTTDRLEYHISRVKGKIWQEFIR